jgi:uncharacterized DUF497 family protein
VADYRDEFFEWDEEKSAATLATRNFDFAFASQIYEGAYIEEYDEKHSDDEDRSYCIGIAGGFVLTVICTLRENRRRILSAWRSRKEDIDRYARQFGEKTDEGSG